MQFETIQNADLENHCGLQYASSTQIGNYLFIFGGFDGKKNTNDMWKFNIETKKFVQLTPKIKPSVRQ